jgi:hypothetical protein
MVLMVKLLFGAIDPRYAISSPYTGRIWQWFWELAREELALPPKMCKVMHSRMESAILYLTKSNRSSFTR